MDRVRKLIHAQEEEIYPWDGSGITVAILDTGECVKEMYPLCPDIPFIDATNARMLRPYGMAPRASGKGGISRPHGGRAIGWFLGAFHAMKRRPASQEGPSRLGSVQGSSECPA